MGPHADYRPHRHWDGSRDHELLHLYAALPHLWPVLHHDPLSNRRHHHLVSLATSGESSLCRTPVVSRALKGKGTWTKGAPRRLRPRILPSIILSLWTNVDARDSAGIKALQPEFEHRPYALDSTSRKEDVVLDRT